VTSTRTDAPAQHAGRLQRFERRVLASSSWVAAPALLSLLASPWWAGRLHFPVAQLCLLAVIVATVWLARWQCRRVTYPVYTLVSLLEALREGDYSLRGVQGGVLDHVVYNINELAARLQQERLDFEEASHLLSKTLAALDSAVFVFDEKQRLRLVNPAGEALLAETRDRLFGRDAVELGLADWLEAPATRLLTHTFPGHAGRFEIRHAALRSAGRSSRLLVINDVGRVLRDEERQAWQRLLRVLGHEVNNSLTPISSMAGTLANLVAREPLPEDWREDFQRGLEVIGQRASSLTRFLSSYSKLARLPAPQRSELELGALVRNVVQLEQRLSVQIASDDLLQVQADADQLEQALINLLRNAVEAAVTEQGGVTVRWRREGGDALVEIDDDGPGPPPSDNLFVPFFTTKLGGSGIGLALARQIAEAHGGGVSLVARQGSRGARATLWLPWDQASAGTRGD
jgi:two-component system, NtrC family, nitrogen regulation sensor histidine kinase NtrY